MKSSFTYRTQIKVSNQLITYLIEIRYKFDVKNYIATIYMIQSGSSLYHTAYAKDDDCEVIFCAIEHCIDKLSKTGDSPITIMYVPKNF